VNIELDSIGAYRDGSPAAPHALAAELAAELVHVNATAVAEGDGWAVYPDGHVVNWADRLDRPTRQRGSVAIDEPGSFADYVTRLVTADTVIYGSRDLGRFVAVFNDHTSTDDDDSGLAGHRDHRASLDLRTDPEWSEWMAHDGKMVPQALFAEFIDSMAHTIVQPSAAVMKEVAQTLTGRQQIDIGSRTNLDNGDVSFRFETETTMRAGRGPTEVEIPQAFRFSVPVWEGTEPVTVEARFRVKAGPSGVQLGYKLIQVHAAMRAAFTEVIGMISSIVGEDVPMYSGHPDAFPNGSRH
jgi:uncharacterized protein YfdQ (DUF2303 family)